MTHSATSKITLDTVELKPTTPANASVIWLHGLGADGHDFVPIAQALPLPPNLAVRFIFPHAPVRPVTINGGFPMRAWFDIHGLTANSRYDLDGIQQMHATITDLIEQEIERGIPPQRIVLAGFSQGGAMALYTGLHYTKKLAGILGLSTFLPMPAELAAKLTAQPIPIFLAHGDFDSVIPLSFAQTTAHQLQQLGYPVSWHTYPMQHEVCNQEILDVRKWLLATLEL
ncbi:MAG: alpha/beta fold hydrolase [Coxiellaceae bacterium]|nr:MAG: alpha/beta fold hydrolase [Coxiellaceae bacterium]